MDSIKNETVGTGKPLMEWYRGSKALLARPMCLGNYNRYRGWEMPKDEDPEEDGYLVEYLDGGKANDHRHKGYISWSPREVFEKAYRKNGQLSIGHAVEAAKNGLMIKRHGWNGKGTFLFMQVPSEISIDIVPKMSSLPESVKSEIKKRFDQLCETTSPELKHHNRHHKGIRYKNQLAMLHPDNTITAWSPSASDVLEEDWFVMM